MSYNRYFAHALAGACAFLALLCLQSCSSYRKSPPREHPRTALDRPGYRPPAPPKPPRPAPPTTPPARRPGRAALTVDPLPFIPAGVTSFASTIVIRGGRVLAVWTNTPALWLISGSEDLQTWTPWLRKESGPPVKSFELDLQKTNDARFWKLESISPLL